MLELILHDMPLHDKFTKLWGTADDLQQMANFGQHHGL
jgi:hypothetical protein